MKTKQYISVLDTDLDKPNWTCDETTCFVI